MATPKFMDNLLASMRGKVPPTQTAGKIGTAVYGGYIVSLEKSSTLTGREKQHTYSELILNTSIVSAAVRYFLNIVSNANWKVEAADDSKEAVKYAELIEEMLHDMLRPWPRVVRRAAMYRLHGYGIQEWTAKMRDDGVMGLLDVAARPQLTIERWDLDVNGNVVGVVQRSPQDSQEYYLPRGKLVYCVDDSLSDSPEGVGLLRHCVEPARRLARFEQLEGYGFEIDLAGTPVGRIPGTALRKMVLQGLISEAQRIEAEQAMALFVENHIKSPQRGIILDSQPYTSQDAAATPSGDKQWDIDIIKGSGGPQAEVAATIERLNREIARGLGVEQILLGSTGAGSHAMSKDKSHTFALVVDGTLKDLARNFETDLIDAIFQLNGWDRKLKPKLKTDAIAYRDIEQVTGALMQLAQAGAPLAPNDPAINEVRDQLGLTDALEVDVSMDASLLSAEGKQIDPKTGQPVKPKPAVAAKPAAGAPPAKGKKPEAPTPGNKPKNPQPEK